MKKYDYIVIGSGPAAYKLVPGLQTGDKRTLVVDGGTFGGICPNYGCEPKIFLEGAVKAVLTSRKLQGLGVSTPATIDWTQLIQRKKAVFKPFPANSIKIYEALGADTLQGTAKFVSAHVLEINGEQYQADKIIIATGQRSNKLPIEGSEYTLSSDDVFDMEQLPERITFIGGGFVSMELATMLSAAGAVVDIIEFADRPLKAFSAEQVPVVMKEMAAQGVQFHLNQAVDQVIKTDQGYRVHTKQGLTINTSVVVDASGRVPNVEKLNLDEIGIKHGRLGISVDDHLETTVKGVFALGDVIEKTAPKLTSTAQFEGEYLSAYLSGQQTTGLHYPVVATAAFTFPQVAQAGVSLDEARDDSRYRVADYDLAQSEHVYVGLNDMTAKLTLIFDQQDKLVGAAEVSQTAADDIDNFVDIIGLALDKDDWRRKFISVFPALAYKTRDLIGK